MFRNPKFSNAMLSKDIPASINYFVNNGYSIITSEFESTVRQMIPYKYTIKYITKENLVRNGGTLSNCDNSEMFTLISGKFKYNVKYDNLKYLFYRVTQKYAIETKEHSGSHVFTGRAFAKLPSEVEKTVEVPYVKSRAKDLFPIISSDN
jgi:hypothetical protein